MKRIYLLLGLMLGIDLSLIAQENTSAESPFTPKQGDFGAMLVLDGLIDNISLETKENQYGSNILFGRYYLKQDLVLRGGFGFTLFSEGRKTADSSGSSLIEIDSSTVNYLINLSTGIEKHFTSSIRLDPYIFGQVDLTFIGKTNQTIDRREISNAGTSTRERTIKQDGGIAIGLNGGIGFNYFLAPRFSVGSELSLGFIFVNEGGTVSDNEVITPVNGAVTSNFSTREDLESTFNFDVNPNALINLSYFF
jgi:hypothetical protein